MLTQKPSSISEKIIYPDSDGKLMADNTKQFELIVYIKENLELLFANEPNVFVAGDLLWYPVQGDNKLCQAPDVMVALGRPKGYRGSYKQWEEDNIPPQVAFEIWSPGNRLSQMAKKFDFYRRYGVEEYYIYDPDTADLTGWQRHNDKLELIDEMTDWVSPRLGVRFELSQDILVIYRPDGQPFLNFIELDRQRQEAENRAQQAENRTQQAEAQLEQERRRTEALEARLREMGIDPNQL
ncbi:MAG: Uma2 family endonuclease [Microcoleus vaginatus WJT46-NPBG5]|jgi:Uma2 family endonuclease|nr:Uma2 family endonuclease [Microcoleus vaginatus WJT46-NPBG5]